MNKIIVINYTNSDFNEDPFTETYELEEGRTFDFDKFYDDVEEEYRKETDKGRDVEWYDILENKEKEYGLRKDNSLVDTYIYLY
jgi:hypothetical protein